MRTLDFTDHRRSLHENQYVYAVVSRRVNGLSIGINLNPDKACNFACPYCQVDRRVPGGQRSIDVDRLRVEIDGLLGLVRDGTLWTVPPFDTAAQHLRRVGDISFAGDGEPTACPDFEAALATVIEARERHGLKHVPMTLLSNATLFHREAVQTGLGVLHRAGGVIWAKLDAGTEAWFQRVDGTTLSFDRVLDNLSFAAQRYRVVIQSMFHAFDGVGPDDAEIAAWAGRLKAVLAEGGRIEMVQVYTVARAPADSSVVPLSRHRLDEIAAAAREVGLSATVY